MYFDVIECEKFHFTLLSICVFFENRFKGGLAVLMSVNVMTFVRLP